MGLLPTIFVVIFILQWYDLITISAGWYYFWFALAALDVLAVSIAKAIATDD